jgi:hypothetical protein
LCTDTGKLKKADMLKLLEKYHKEQWTGLYLVS